MDIKEESDLETDNLLPFILFMVEDSVKLYLRFAWLHVELDTRTV